MSAHVAVIGAGIAGFSAAIGARRGGARVTVFSSHAGATRFAGGAWDVAPADDALAPRRTVSEWIARTASHQSSHPYAHFSGDLLASLKTSHDEVLSALQIYRAIDWDGYGVRIRTDRGFERHAATAQESILKNGEVVESIARGQGQALADAMKAAFEREGITQRFCDVADVGVDVIAGSDITAVVFATGKFLGGTLSFTEGRVHVTPALPHADAFADAAPVATPTTADGHDPLLLFGNDILGNAPGHRLGLGYDTDFHILNAEMQIANPRYFAAGSALSGFDPARDGSGFGACTLTGYFAGQHAAKQSQ